MATTIAQSSQSIIDGAEGPGLGSPAVNRCGTSSNVLQLSGSMTGAAFLTAVNAAPAGDLCVRPTTGQQSFTVTTEIDQFPGFVRPNVTISGAVFQEPINFSAAADGLQLCSSTLIQFILRGTDNVLLDSNTFDGQFRSDIAQNWMLQNTADDTDGVSNVTVTNNKFMRYDPLSVGNHSESCFVAGYANGVLFEDNIFTDGGTTGHLFFSWFGGSGTDPTTFPQNICVRHNYFDLSHNGFYHIQIREEIDPVAKKINVEAPPSNLLGPSIPGETTSLASFATANCVPYPPF